jgi:hypothetical protein
MPKPKKPFDQWTQAEKDAWREESRQADGYACARLKRSCGLELKSVYDLVNSREEVSQAIPVFLELLDEITNENIYSGIVRCLGVKAARGIANRRLIDEFRRVAPTDPDLGWVIAMSLSVTSTQEDCDTIWELLHDKRYGHARSGLVYGFRDCLKSRVTQALRDALNEDPRLQWETLDAIGKYKLTALAEEVAKFLDHPDGERRRLAHRVHERLLKARTKEAAQSVQQAAPERPKRRARSAKRPDCGPSDRG